MGRRLDHPALEAHRHLWETHVESTLAPAAAEYHDWPPKQARPDFVDTKDAAASRFCAAVSVDYGTRDVDPVVVPRAFHAPDWTSVRGAGMAAATESIPPDFVLADSLPPDSLPPDSILPDSMPPDSIAPDSIAPDSPPRLVSHLDEPDSSALELDPAAPESLALWPKLAGLGRPSAPPAVLQEERDPSSPRVLGVAASRLPTGSLLIEGTLPQGRAAQGGLKIGDVVVRVNGLELSSVDVSGEWLSAQHAEGGRLELDVMDTMGLHRIVDLSSRKG